jgi:Predicted membrane protein
LEDVFKEGASHIALVFEIVAVVVIAVGGVESLWQLVAPIFKRVHDDLSLRKAWLCFARWLILGLEFTLAADVIRTSITPTWDAIGQLAAIATIRTALSFFLEKDMEKVFKKELPPP